MQTWTKVGRLEDIPRLGASVLRREHEGNVAVFRTADDKLFALLDRCPHRGSPLSQGTVYGEPVACLLHNMNVDLALGEALAPDKGCVKNFPVKMEGSAVFVARGAWPRTAQHARAWPTSAWRLLRQSPPRNDAKLSSRALLWLTAVIASRL